MRIITLLYVSITIIYFLVSDGSLYWALLNSFNTLAYIVVLLSFKFKKDIYTQFATQLTIGRIIYTSICAISHYDWIYSMNKVFATIYLIWLIITIIVHHLNGGQKFP